LKNAIENVVQNNGNQMVQSEELIKNTQKAVDKPGWNLL
jgi:hypothetical protein